MKMKTTISIPDALFKAAERLAKRLGIPRSRLYSRAIERYVSEAERPDVTALLNKIYQNESSELDPVLEALQSVATPREQGGRAVRKGNFPKAFCPWQ